MTIDGPVSFCSWIYHRKKQQTWCNRYICTADCILIENFTTHRVSITGTLHTARWYHKVMYYTHRIVKHIMLLDTLYCNFSLLIPHEKVVQYFYRVRLVDRITLSTIVVRVRSSASVHAIDCGHQGPCSQNIQKKTLDQTQI